MRYSPYSGSRFWARGFLVATLIHWIIILLMLWWWTSYQRSETLYQAKVCWVFDKQPVIQTIQTNYCPAVKPVPPRIIIKRIVTPAPRPKSYPPPARPRVVSPPPKQQIATPEPPPIEDQPDLDAERERIARAYTDRLRIKILASQRYPEPARRRGEEGISTVMFDIKKDGKIANTRIKNSSGYQELDNAALEAIYQISPVEPIPQTILDRLNKDHWTFSIPVIFTLTQEK